MPKHQLTPQQAQLGMRMSMLDGIFAQAFYGLTWPAGVFITGLALHLKATNFEIGLIAALGPLLSGIYLIAGRLLEKFQSRKKFLIVNAAIHRGVFLLLFILPFAIGISARLQIGLLMLVIFMSTVFGIFQGTAWMSWMADMIPADRRGAFFSKRNMFCGFVWMLEAFLFGKFIDTYEGVWGYTVIFGIGVALSFVAMIFLIQQPEPPIVVSEKRSSLGGVIKSAFKLSSFRNFLIFQVLWSFTTQLAGPFYNVYMLQSFHLDIARITLWGIIGGVVGTVTMPYWGLLGDKAGNKPTLLLCLIGSCSTAFGWLFVNPDNINWLLPVLFGLSGFFDTGVGLIAFNMLLAVMPEKDKPSYLGIFEAIVGTMAGFAPLLGGYLATVLPQVHLSFLTMTPVLLVIFISTIVRLIPVAFVTTLPAKYGHSFGFMFREFVFANPIKLFSSLYFVQKSPTQKIEAMDNLSSMKSKAALPDLIKSIHDLNPRVRRKAVQAIGEIGDKRAVDPLIEALNDTLEDIRGEAALALGKIGDKKATASLMKLLDSSDLHLQSCAAQALGDIKSESSSDALITLMKTTTRTSVMLPCADALGRIGSFHVVEPLLEMSRSVKDSQIKHSLVASAGLLIDSDGDLYKALSQTDLHSAQAAGEILSPRIVKFAKSSQNPLRKNLSTALQAYHKKNYNEAVVEMKLLNQSAVREYLACKELKSTLGFEQWVRILDSSFTDQLETVQKWNRLAGIALAIVDYYARHCPVAAEPDMDHQEFMLALYAFKTGQIELYKMVFGRSVIQDKLKSKLEDLSEMVDV